MEISLLALRDAIEPAESARAEARYARLSGKSRALPNEAAAAAFTHPEVFRFLSEEATSPKRTEPAKRKLQMLRTYAALELERHLGREARAALTRKLTDPVRAGEPMSLETADSALAEESSRDRREVIERGVATHLETCRSEWAQLVEAAIETPQRLGGGSYLSLWDDLSGFSHRALGEQAQAALIQTEDAYRDLLAFAMGREDRTIKPRPHGLARAHDLSRAVRAAHLDGVFEREELRAGTFRFLGELFGDPTAGKRVKLDDERRPDKSPHPFAVAVSVPSDVRLGFVEDGGLLQYAGLLRAAGEAHGFAHRDEALPVEYRLLGSSAPRHALGYLFEGLLQSTRFTRRYLKSAIKETKDGIHAATLFSLASFRRDCATLLFELDLYGRGPSAGAVESFTSNLSDGLSVSVREDACYRGVTPGFAVAGRLHGRALEVILRQRLTERFDEDFYRNPAAGGFLTARLAKGTEGTAAEWAADLAGELSLARVGKSLLAALE